MTTSRRPGRVTRTVFTYRYSRLELWLFAVSGYAIGAWPRWTTVAWIVGAMLVLVCVQVWADKRLGQR